MPELEELIEEVKSHPDFAEAGCVATFTGVVRGVTGGNEVDHLEFESYEGVARDYLDGLEDELREREGVVDVRMHHETGRLEVGEDIVHVVVAAGHREEGFSVCREGIDRLKEEVPIWKKEVGEEERWMHEERGG